MKSADYISDDATGLAKGIRDGKLGRDEVLDAARQRIAACNPTLNAVIDLYADPVDDGETRGHFDGVPFLLKDIGAGIAGKQTGMASRAFRNTPPQTHDDELTRRFRASGLRILGKTNLPELGFNVTSEPLLHGPTRNPYDLSRSAGGSSGGAAAAVASGMVPIAHATDGAGSIRIPAACCGLVGLKPSRGLIPQGPAHTDIYGGLVTEGVVSRTVRDSALALSVMRGRDAGAPYESPHDKPWKAPLRIGILLEGAEDITFDDDVTGAVLETADGLRRLGHQVQMIEGFLPSADWRIPREVYLAQVCAQAAADFAGKPIPDGLETINRAAIEWGRAMTAEDYLSVLRKGHDMARRFARIWQSFDLLLSPALASAAPLLGQFSTGHGDVPLHVDRMTRLAPFAGLFNLTGGAALVVSVGRNAQGLPLGIQLGGDIGSDGMLLALGEALHLPPPVMP